MMKKFFLWIVSILSAALAFVIILVAIFVFIQIPVDLSGQNSFFTKTTGNVMGRKVIIEGESRQSNNVQDYYC